MTDTTTLAPTDAEILDAAEAFRSQYTHGGTTFDEFDEIGFARAVLAKWGTPAPVGVGEVAERYRNAIASACEGWTMPDGLRKHLETALWSPPTPQPTHSQAAQADNVQEEAARLDFLIDQGAYVVSDPGTCPGYWLHWARPDGDTWVQVDEYPTPRAAIDAARKQGARWQSAVRALTLHI